MTRRTSLERITFNNNGTHAGLWLDKYLKDDADGSKQALIEDACKAGIPDGYAAAYDSRFGEGEGKRPTNTLCAEAEVDNCRLIIGLGQKGVLEAGITLDHTWGVPYIPGSALKGIAAWAALQSDQEVWNKIIEKSGDKRRVGDCYLALFGGPDKKDKDEKGCVIFHDAWWIPEGNKLPIHLDVMTVHHQKYYQDGNTPPSDMDSPMPVPFVSVTGKFMIMLEGPEEWREVAIALLKYGLENHGIGAKTAGGYGRMKVEWKSQDELRREEDEKKRRDQIETQIKQEQEIDSFTKNCNKLISNQDKGTVIQAIMTFYNDSYLKNSDSYTDDQKKRIDECKKNVAESKPFKDYIKGKKKRNESTDAPWITWIEGKEKKK